MKQRGAWVDRAAVGRVAMSWRLLGPLLSSLTWGDKYMHGTALITGISVSASVDGMVDASYSLKGTGALTQATE